MGRLPNRACDFAMRSGRPPVRVINYPPTLGLAIAQGCPLSDGPNLSGRDRLASVPAGLAVSASEHPR